MIEGGIDARFYLMPSSVTAFLGSHIFALGQKKEILAMYLLGGAVFSPSLKDIPSARIILNPGIENDDLQARAAVAEIKTLKVCTQVLLKIGKF